MAASASRAFWVTLIASLIGAIASFILGPLVVPSSPSESGGEFARYKPFPHHVPKHAGGIVFRFAMAHDVIHERFPRHGLAYHRERIRLTREKLAKLSPKAPLSFDLADDLAASLHRIGKTDEAIAVIRDKLARQLDVGFEGKQLYTSYANLGTFLIHASHDKAMAGDPVAREQFCEGTGLIRQAVEVNPEAHFGREQWQAAIAEFLLATMDRPELLKTFDFLGNRLDRATEQILERGSRPYLHTDWPGFSQEVVEDPGQWKGFGHLRENVKQIGAEAEWDTFDVPSHRKPVAFDEPVLGIIGMWREGGGANPHLALALGETMLRIGQRYIAWCAFERASRLANEFSPDAPVQESLRDHCRRRQKEIEENLLRQNNTPRVSEGTVERLRADFEAELAHGESYQRAYQQYEAEKIAAGVPITDERFYEEFHAGREPIASPTGPEEWFAVEDMMKGIVTSVKMRLAWALFGAGVGAMVSALIFRAESWRRSRSASYTRPQAE